MLRFASQHTEETIRTPADLPCTPLPLSIKEVGTGETFPGQFLESFNEKVGFWDVCSKTIQKYLICYQFRILWICMDNSIYYGKIPNIQASLSSN